MTAVRSLCQEQELSCFARATEAVPGGCGWNGGQGPSHSRDSMSPAGTIFIPRDILYQCSCRLRGRKPSAAPHV